MAKILVVTKDIGGGFNTLNPVVKLLRDRGHEVVIVAEGNSLAKWTETGENVYGGIPAEEEVDKNSKIRFDIDAEKVLSEIRPDAVITELAAPIHLGEEFALAANKVKIPLIFVEDLWGVHKRSTAVPNLICTLDTFGAIIAIRDYGRYDVGKIIPTGSPAMDDIYKTPTNSIIQQHLGQLGEKIQKPIILILGQDESTTPMIDGLVELLNSSESMSGSIVIPRFHPKFMSDNYAELRSRWLTSLSKLRSADVYYISNSVPIRQLMAIANITISIYSTGLLEALHLGSLPVSWVSDIGREKMRQAIGFTRFPLVSAGCCVEVDSPREFTDNVLNALGNYSPLAITQKSREMRNNMNADDRSSERVVDAIEDLLKK